MAKDGKWVIDVRARQGSKSLGCETYELTGKTVEHAKADGCERMKKKYPNGDYFFGATMKTITEPVYDTIVRSGTVVSAPVGKTDEEKAWEKALGNIQFSNDAAATVLDLMNFKKIASKLGTFGLVLNGVDMVNDLCKWIELAGKYAVEKDARKKYDTLWEMLKLSSKGFKTIVTSAVPVAGFADLGYTVITKVKESIQSSNQKIADKKVEEKLMAKKAEYDRFAWREDPSSRDYDIEWRAYAAGATKDELLTLRNIARDKRMGADGKGDRHWH